MTKRILRCHPLSPGGYDPLLDCHLEVAEGDREISPSRVMRFLGRLRRPRNDE